MSYSGYQDLKVYQLSYQLALEIFKLSKSFPAEERYSLTDQMRRSSRSVVANLVEAWARRKYRKNFISKITEAIAEASETQIWLNFAKDFGYLTNDQFNALMTHYSELLKMFHGVIRKADKFCY